MALLDYYNLLLLMNLGGLWCIFIIYFVGFFFESVYFFPWDIR